MARKTARDAIQPAMEFYQAGAALEAQQVAQQIAIRFAGMEKYLVWRHAMTEATTILAAILIVKGLDLNMIVLLPFKMELIDVLKKSVVTEEKFKEKTVMTGIKMTTEDVYQIALDL